MRPAVLALFLCAGSCDASTSGSKATSESNAILLVAAASSLRDLLTAAAVDFERDHPGTELAFTFEASSTLARQAAAGAEFDVLISADRETLERCASKIDPSTLAEFLGNRLALVCRTGLSAKPGSPEDLVGFPGTIALAGPAVPAGRYARAELERRGLLASLEPRFVEGRNARATLSLVESQAAEFAIVYRTDALASQAVETAWVSDREEPEAAVFYVAAALRGSHPRARDLLGFLAGPAFQERAREAGFLPIPPAARAAREVPGGRKAR